ncbi:hypothetical protein MKY63_08970 [Paenibacillus sp. FSL R7-0189]|uniref:hypothetical protein n=1 Tax=Paenibacillus sp. FSL R7-0189 TaxID=2921673 RepID=UPI0030DCDC2A
MDIKRVIIVGTVVVVMSFGNAWTSLTANASSPVKWSTAEVADQDELLEVLNQPTDEDLYEAIYDGKSLQDIASEQGQDIEAVIDLQVAQLTDQLDSRLAVGSITTEQYAAYKAELRDIVSDSVHTSFG